MSLLMEDIEMGNHFVEDVDDNYDEFFKKWRKKRKERRAKNPKITTKRTLKKASTAVKGSVQNPITNKDLKADKVLNNAMQNELKTLQEQQKVEGLQKKVEQEDLKKETLAQQAGLMGAGKGLIVVVGVLGTLGLLVYISK